MRHDEVDAALRLALDALHAMEQAGEIESMEVPEAQRLLIEAASWQRGVRPPTTFEEAWERMGPCRRAATAGCGDWMSRPKNWSWWNDPCECDDCDCDCLQGDGMKLCWSCDRGDHEPHPELWRPK